MARGYSAPLDRVHLRNAQARGAADKARWTARGPTLLGPLTAHSYGQQQAKPSVESLLAEWRAEHGGLHGCQAMRHALDQRFLEDFPSGFATSVSANNSAGSGGSWGVGFANSIFPAKLRFSLNP